MKKSKLHPAWLMLISCCFIQFGGTGILSNSIGIFMPAVCNEMNFTRAQYSMHLTFKGLLMVLFLPIAGKLITKVKPRILLTAAALIGAGALGASAFFTKLFQWYIGGALCGISGAFLFMTMSPIILNQWFKEKSGLAIGLAMACSGLGGAVMNPLGTLVINSYGWRVSALVMAGISLLFTVPFTVFFLKVKPSDIGVEPYGADKEQRVVLSSEANTVKQPQGHRITPVGGIVFFTALLIAFPIVFNNHFPQYAMSIGLTNTIGAGMSSFCMIGNISGKLGLGWINDRIETQKSIFAGGLTVILGFCLILFGGTSSLYLMAGSMLYGVSMSLTAVAVPLIVKDLFDRDNYNMALSYATMATSLVSGVGVWVVGYLYDIFGGYPKCLVLGIFCYLLMLIMVKFCYAVRPPPSSLS